MRIRKSRTQKFYIEADNSELFIELRTIPKSVTTQAVGLATEQRIEQPTTSEGIKKLRAKDSIEIKQTIKADLVYRHELKASIVSFALPGENDEIITSKGMSPDQMVDFLDMVDDDLDYVISQSVDIMQGNYPDSRDWARLEKMGVTPQMMGLSDSEAKFPVEDPLVLGNDALDSSSSP